jgi:transaldolase
MPPATIDAFLDHGEVHPNSLATDVNDAEEQIRRLGEYGIDFDEITDELQVEGVAAFADSFDELIEAIAAKSAALRS